MRGQGNVYQQVYANGKKGAVWWLRFYAEGEKKRKNGKPDTFGAVLHRESSGTTDRAKALKLLKLRVAQAMMGRPIATVEAAKLRLKDLFQAVRDHYEAEDLRSAYLIDPIENHLLRYFESENFKLAAITRGRLDDYREKRKAQGTWHRIDYVEAHRDRYFPGDEDGREFREALKSQKHGTVRVPPSASTISRELRMLKHGFELLADKNRIVRDSIPSFPPLKESPHRTGHLEPADFAQVLEALPDDLKDPFDFLCQSAWRINEILTLKRRDVDRVNLEIHLRPENSKTAKPRMLPLFGAMLEIIDRALERHPALNDPVFQRTAGGAIPYHYALNSWHVACVACGYGRKLIPHDLRRSGVRNMRRAGIPENVVMKISGHKSVAVFQQYNIASDGDVKEAVQIADAFVKQQKMLVPKVTQLHKVA